MFNQWAVEKPERLQEKEKQAKFDRWAGEKPQRLQEKEELLEQVEDEEPLLDRLIREEQERNVLVNDDRYNSEFEEYIQNILRNIKFGEPYSETSEIQDNGNPYDYYKRFDPPVASSSYAVYQLFPEKKHSSNEQEENETTIKENKNRKNETAEK